MYPYFTIRWSKIYMTGIGIVVSFLAFVIIVWYLSKRYLQWFWKFFYWLPIVITITYFLWSYTQFILSNQSFFPMNLEEIFSILWPYGYKFHFAGVLAWLVFSLLLFFRKIKTIENKKIWSDIFFYAFSLSLVPLGLFLLLWDNFIGNTTDSLFWMKALHSESQWNKFGSVLPIWLFLSLGSLFVVFFVHIKRIILKKKGFWLQWLAFLVIVINIVLVMQQYPRYMVISLWDISLDIKQHLSFFVVMLCLYYHKKWNIQKPVLDNQQ